MFDNWELTKVPSSPKKVGVSHFN